MALKNLFSWNQKNAAAPAGACGTACGAGDKPAGEKTPAACGTACGAGDKPAEEKTPAACGTACGAGER